MSDESHTDTEATRPTFAEDPTIAEDPAPEPHIDYPALIQDIVDFLHRLFPGHGAPGTPRETA